MEYIILTTVLGFFALLLPIFKIVVDVNRTLTTLNVTMQYINEDTKANTCTLKDVGASVSNHETRIFVLEEKHK